MGGNASRPPRRADLGDGRLRRRGHDHRSAPAVRRARAAAQQSVQVTTYPRVLANADLGPQRGTGEPHSRSALVDARDARVRRAAVGCWTPVTRTFSRSARSAAAVSDVPATRPRTSHRSANFSVVAIGANADRLDGRGEPSPHTPRGHVPELRQLAAPRADRGGVPVADARAAARDQGRGRPCRECSRTTSP